MKRIVQLLFLGCLAAIGCGGGSTQSSSSAQPKAASAKNEAQEQCAALLGSVWDTFQLRRMGVSTELQAGVALLNQWRDACAPAASAEVKLPAEAQSQLAPEILSRLNEARFSERDGMHLRDCVLFKQVNSYAVGRASTDLQRATNLFQHVVRAISLVTEHAENLPLAPYESYLLGEGTPADRAWIFASLLRQLKIDAYLLSEAIGHKSAPPELGTFLVGVPLDGEVYLFDPRLGLPVPPLGGKGMVATLSQAVADANVLKQFDLDAEFVYELTANGLRSPRVFLIGDACFWSGRMRQLQSVFTGKQALVIADGLDDASGAPGAWSRAAAGKSHWNVSSLALWIYPETQLEARSLLTEDEEILWGRVTESWKAPMQIVNFDPMTRMPVFSRPQGDQLKMRLAHVQGDFEEAILGFTNMRLTSVMYILSPPLDIPIPEALQVMHRRAVDDATLWTGMCQFEQANYRMAADTFQKFLKTRTTGARATSARYHLALCQNALKDRAAAVKTLAGTPKDDPQYAGHQLLIRQWNAAP